MTEEGKEKKAILPLPTRDPLLVVFCTLIIDGMLQHGAGEPIAVHCRLPGYSSTVIGFAAALTNAQLPSFCLPSCCFLLRCRGERYCAPCPPASSVPYA